MDRRRAAAGVQLSARRSCRTSPIPISRLVDAERRAQFMREGVHYEGDYVIIVQFTPPLRRRSKVADLIYDDDPAETSQPGQPSFWAVQEGHRATWRMRSATP